MQRPPAPTARGGSPHSPIVDVLEATVAFQGDLLETVRKLPRSAVRLLSKIMLKKMSETQVLLAFKQYTDWTAGMYRTTMDPINKLDAGIRFLEPFTVREDLENISGAALALVGDGDGEVLIRQAEEFVAGVSSSTRKLHRFSIARDGSDDHCQLDNRSRGGKVMFDFLDEFFGYRCDPPAW